MNRACKILFPFQNEMKKYVTVLKIKLKSLLSFDQKNEVVKLLYQYKHLNSMNFSNLSKTDFIIHRIKFVSKTKPYFVNQKRWSFHKKWWFRKLIQNDINKNVYEKTNLIDERFSSWNAKTILIDKIENFTSNDELRMTYDYSRVVKELSEIYISLMFECHDYFFDPRHWCFMTTNFKHVYFTILVHSENRKFFAFTIFEIRQLQFIRMQQKSKSVFFIMSKLMARVLKKISNESSLFQNQISESSLFLTYYQNDIMSEHESFQKQFAFFRNYFFFQNWMNSFSIFFQKIVFVSDFSLDSKHAASYKRTNYHSKQTNRKNSTIFDFWKQNWNTNIFENDWNHSKMNFEFFRNQQIFD